MSNPRNNELRFDAFQSTPKKTAKGYEILVIHASQANGWNFPASVLQEAVKMWESIECFADHNMYGESVHDLAGVFSNPRWDETEQGIIADLRPTGPAAEMLRTYADEMFSDHDPHPNMGFSPVLIFTSEDKDVTHILRVRSEDMVINPAFQTKFVAEKFQQRSITMPETTTPAAPTPAEAQEHLTAMQQITGAQTEITTAVKGAQDMHLEACQNLLNTALEAASVDLPAAMTDLIRARFTGKTFKATELKAEIDSFKTAFTQQTAAASIV